MNESTFPSTDALNALDSFKDAHESLLFIASQPPASWSEIRADYDSALDKLLPFLTRQVTS